MTSSRRADALVAAAETLDALAIDQSCVIDPFEAIDALGLALSITKLDNLLGAVVPHGQGGVLITSERSPAIQRYTAAHEIGHWILHEKHLQVDGEDEVLGRPSNEFEQEAQLFAGYFLMPPTLLDHVVAAYELQSGHIGPEHVYRLSRDMDVSYEAAARRLLTARLIDRTTFNEIWNFSRMSAMQRASAGHRPADGLADVWDATSDEELVHLVVEEHDEIIVDLTEQRLTGWRWQTPAELARRNAALATPRPRPMPPGAAPVMEDHTWVHAGDFNQSFRDADQEVVGSNHALDTADNSEEQEEELPAVIVSDTFGVGSELEKPLQLRRRRSARARGGINPNEGGMNDMEPLIGGNGIRTFVVRTATFGEWNLKLFYAHAFDPRNEPILSYELRLTIQPCPNTSFRIRQLKSDLDIRFQGDPDDDAEFEVEVSAA
jgi:Zn-dependent peptidase ImmA (M78 family)